MNKVICIGRLCADPELRETPNGVFVCSFRIAVDRPGREKGTDFLSVAAWRERAQFVSKYFHKGDPIGVEGSLQSRTYEDRTGARRTAVEIAAERLFFLPGSRAKAGDDEEPQVSLPGRDFEDVDERADLPF